MGCQVKRKQANGLYHQTLALMGAFLLAPNAIIKRYHQTLALMGATRLASG